MIRWPFCFKAKESALRELQSCSLKGSALSSLGWNPREVRRKAASALKGPNSSGQPLAGLGPSGASATVGLRPRLLTAHRFAVKPCWRGWGEAPLVRTEAQSFALRARDSHRDEVKM